MPFPPTSPEVFRNLEYFVPLCGQSINQSETGKRVYECVLYDEELIQKEMPSFLSDFQVCGGCKARFFVPRLPGASPGSLPGQGQQAEVTTLCISSSRSGESFPLQDTTNRIQPYANRWFTATEPGEKSIATKTFIVFYAHHKTAVKIIPFLWPSHSNSEEKTDLKRYSHLRKRY